MVIDIAKMAKEFDFLQAKLKKAAYHMSEHQSLEAMFIIGCLHTVCLRQSELFQLMTKGMSEEMARMEVDGLLPPGPLC